MNPRHRRLLIPGLLVALVVVVVIASLTRRADAIDTASASGAVSTASASGAVSTASASGAVSTASASGAVSTAPASGAVSVEPIATPIGVIDDARITEASGLAISRNSDGLGYVINDSGNEQAIHAVDLASGSVVGTTRVTGGTWQDTEALAIDADGTLWVADIGDNLAQRSDVALYSLPEPGRGDRTVEAQRHVVSYPDGAHNAETLLLDPRDGSLVIVTKGLLSGAAYRLPADLGAGATTAERLDVRTPGVVTDGAFTPDGDRILLRTYATVHELSPDDWSARGTIPVPQQEQAESLAASPDGRSFVIGTEGRPAPMFRVALTMPAPGAEPTGDSSPPPVDRGPVDEPASWWWIGGGAVVVAVTGLLVARRVLRRT